MKPLWTPSGRFAGGREGDRLYDAQGTNVGHFAGNVAYSVDGD